MVKVSQKGKIALFILLLTTNQTLFLLQIFESITLDYFHINMIIFLLKNFFSYSFSYLK